MSFNIKILQRKNIATNFIPYTYFSCFLNALQKGYFENPTDCVLKFTDKAFGINKTYPSCLWRNEFLDDPYLHIKNISDSNLVAGIKYLSSYTYVIFVLFYGRREGDRLKGHLVVTPMDADHNRDTVGGLLAFRFRGKEEDNMTGQDRGREVGLPVAYSPCKKDQYDAVIS